MTTRDSGMPYTGVTADQSHVPSHPSSRLRWGETHPVAVKPEEQDADPHHSAANAGTLGSTSIKVSKVDLSVGSLVPDEEGV